MYVVKSSVFTKLANPVGEFGDVLPGFYNELNVDAAELADLIAKGQIVELRPRQSTPEDVIGSETEDEDEAVEVNPEEIAVPYSDDEHVVLVINDTAGEKPSKAKVTKGK